MLLNLLDDMFFAAIPAVSFTILFNVPHNALKYCAYLGALGHGSRTLMMQFGLSQSSSSSDSPSSPAYRHSSNRSVFSGSHYSFPDTAKQRSPFVDSSLAVPLHMQHSLLQTKIEGQHNLGPDRLPLDLARNKTHLPGIGVGGVGEHGRQFAAFSLPYLSKIFNN